MSNIVEYSFGDKKFGTTINAVTFEILVNGVAKPLTNTTIEAVFRRCNNDGTVMKTLTIGDGITVVDELGGKFKFDEWVNDFAKGSYVYDIKLEYPNEENRIYVYGDLTSTQASTR